MPILRHDMKFIALKKQVDKLKTLEAEFKEADKIRIEYLKKPEVKEYKKTLKSRGAEHEKLGFRFRVATILKVGSIFTKVSKRTPKMLPK